MKGWRLTLIRAYGKDFKTKEEVLKAWKEGKDFYVMTPGHSPYINNRDAKKYGVPENFVRIRFNQCQDFVDIDVLVEEELPPEEEEPLVDSLHPEGI